MKPFQVVFYRSAKPGTGEIGPMPEILTTEAQNRPDAVRWGRTAAQERGWRLIEVSPATHAQSAAQQPMDTTPNTFIGPSVLGAGRLEPTNIRAALDETIVRARTADTAIAAREALEEATGLLELLCDAAVTCRCGGLLDKLTGICGECIERREQLDATFRRIDAALAYHEEGIPF